METPNMSRCDLLTNNYYKNLCQVLSIQPGTNPNTKPFTGNKATDIIILEKLNDNDLISVCSTNKYLNDLCNTESFWMNRTLSKFPFLGSGEEIARRYIPEGVGWKEYYIWLSDMALRDLRILEKVPDREDIKLLVASKSIGHGTPLKSTARIAFFMLFVMNDNMLQFFRQANLGKVNPRDPNSSDLRDVLYSLKTGISTIFILTKLFDVYIRVNNMAKQLLNEKYYLTATPEMYPYFRNTFAKLQAKPQIYNIEDQPLPKFDPTHFTYMYLQDIIKDNIIPRFSPEYEYHYQAPDEDALVRDRQILGNILKFYRR